MNEISIGAVGAAAIAGLVSLLGLIIAKEQKVSEFRQAWIDELRKCFVAYLVNINAISDTIRIAKSGEKADKSALVPSYKALNEASLGIKLRINPDEAEAARLLAAMDRFEQVAASDETLTPENIRLVESEFLTASKKLLKFEWKRVKRGEKIFVGTKIVVGVLVVVMLALLIFGLAGQSSVSSAPYAGPESRLPGCLVNERVSEAYRRGLCHPCFEYPPTLNADVCGFL